MYSNTRHWGIHPFPESLTDPWIELFLGSHGPLFWKTANLPLRVTSFLWVDNLGRQSNFLCKFGCCPCNLCLCRVDHRRSGGRSKCRSVFPSRARLVDGILSRFP